MRGKHRIAIRFHAAIRIIPAHAGQTRMWAGRSCLAPDHPRACGANLRTGIPASVNAGSSPRMRGKLSGDEHAVWPGRIIPAHAGQTP